jgi:hypothetical protein
MAKPSWWREVMVMYFMCGLGQIDPSLGVKFLGIEEAGQMLILLNRQLSIMQDPFTIPEHAVRAPVDEHSKFCVLKLLPGL